MAIRLRPRCGPDAAAADFDVATASMLAASSVPPMITSPPALMLMPEAISPCTLTVPSKSTLR